MGVGATCTGSAKGATRPDTIVETGAEWLSGSSVQGTGQRLEICGEHLHLRRDEEGGCG